MNLWEGFWFLMIWGSVAWYALLVFVIGWKGYQDIRRMIGNLEEKRED